MEVQHIAYEHKHQYEHEQQHNESLNTKLCFFSVLFHFCSSFSISMEDFHFSSRSISFLRLEIQLDFVRHSIFSVMHETQRQLTPNRTIAARAGILFNGT